MAGIAMKKHSLSRIFNLKRSPLYIKNGRVDKPTSVKGDVLALLVLNPTLALKSIFEILWRNASIRICADGGANQLYDRFGNEMNSYIPDLIHGDLDSLRPEVGRFYKKNGTVIVKDEDQDSHDLEKCILFLQNNQLHGSNVHIVIIGAFGGRLDHEMANINMTYRYSDVFGSLILLSDKSSGFLLNPGKHEIYRSELYEKAQGCGLIPFGCQVSSITTSGLKWNLSNQATMFKGLVSTSNEIVESPVCITTSHPIFWTTTLRKLPTNPAKY